MANIERLALRVYANDRTPDRALQRQVRVSLKNLAVQLRTISTQGELQKFSSACADMTHSTDCLPGWVCCEGVCVPEDECDPSLM